MGQIPQDGENGQNVAFFYFLERLCPLDSKNVLVLVLTHLEPELELFELMTLAMMVMMICRTIISQTSNSSLF